MEKEQVNITPKTVSDNVVELNDENLDMVRGGYDDGNNFWVGGFGQGAFGKAGFGQGLGDGFGQAAFGPNGSGQGLN